MKKPVFCINRLNHFKAIIFASYALLFALSFLTIFPIADDTARASAEVDASDYLLSLQMGADIDFTVTPSRTGKMTIVKDTITGSTNAPTGYKLFISSANEFNSIYLDGEEDNDDDVEAKMSPTSGTFDAPEMLYSSADTPATWGYAIANLNNFDASYDVANPSESSKFAAMPASGSGQLIRTQDSAISDDSIDVYYGTKVGSRLRSGKYKTWINYVAITDLSSEISGNLSVFPHRIRDNYKPGTIITITADFDTAEDVGILLPTLGNETCTNVKKLSDSPLTVTCEIPENLTIDTYDLSLHIPQLGKTFTLTDAVNIVDRFDAMQTIDKEVYDSTIVDESYQFYDTRDNKKYFVTKTKSGDIIMSQSLDFEISAEGTTLSPETSDVTTEKTIYATTDFDQLTDEQKKNPALIIYKDEGDYYYSYEDSALVSTDGLDVESPLWATHAASSYSYSAAIAEPISDNMSGADSICPKGWHLMSVTPYDAFYTDVYGMSFRGDGSYVNSDVDESDVLHGSYWGANYARLNLDIANGFTTMTTTIRTAAEIKDEIETTGSNPVGAIRCIYYAPKHFKLSFDTNGGSNAPETEIVGEWDAANHNFKISKTAPTRERYIFKGWSEDPTSEALYQPGDTFVATGEHTLYAIWEFNRSYTIPTNEDYFTQAFEAAGKTLHDGYYALQDMTKGICDAVPISSSIYEAFSTKLIDLRDNKIYHVAKMHDGKCWMTQNLNFELSSEGTILTTDTSSVAKNVILSPSDFTGNYYQSYDNTYFKDGYIEANAVTDGITMDYPESHYYAGSAYSYAAATVNAKAANLSGDAVTESICPKGWRLPRVNSEENEIAALYPSAIVNSEDENYAGQFAAKKYTVLAPLYYLANGLNNSSAYIDDNGYEQIRRNFNTILTADLSENRRESDQLGFVRCVAEETIPRSIIFDANGGDYTIDTLYILESLYDSEGNPKSDEYQVTIPTDRLLREGYSFRGWSLRNDVYFADYQPGDQITITGSQTLYAVWQEIRNFPEALQAVNAPKIDNRYTITSVSEEVCTSIPAVTTSGNEPTIQVVDPRDHKLYFVSKMKDGHCWMTQNLDYELNSLTTLYGDYTDILDDAKVISLSAPIDEVTEPLPESRVIAYTDGGNIYLENGTDPASSTGIGSDSSDHHYEVGSFYSFGAAVVASDRGLKSTAADPADAMESICPKGWHLPNASGDRSFDNLMAAYGNDNTLFSRVFYLPHAGSYSNLTHEPQLISTATGYWTSKLGEDISYAYAFAFDNDLTNILTSSTLRAISFNVRCVAGNVEKDAPTIANLGTMQGITPRVVESSAENSVNVAVIDERDATSGLTYEVGKMADGHVWMLSNLRFASNTLSPVNSDVIMNRTLPTSGTRVPYYQATPDTAYLANGSTLSQYAESGHYDHYNLGYYYNHDYAAAGGLSNNPATIENEETNETYLRSNESVCPKGWRLPTSTGDYSFSELLNAYDLSEATTADLLISPLWLGLAGYYTTENSEDALADYPEMGITGNYWTADAIATEPTPVNPEPTYLDITDAKALSIDANGADAAANKSVHAAYNIRCVAR